MTTNYVSGLSSGFDWESVVTQLIAVEHQRVDLVTAKKTTDSSKLTEWQSFNTKLLALKTASDNLKDADAFDLYKASMTTDSSTVGATSLLTVSASESASVGTYSLKINNLAAAQKLSSAPFTSSTTALGNSYAGDVLINGSVITIAAADTLNNVMTKINNANSGSNPSGVTASLVTYGTGDNRLILTSESTGATGIALANGGGTDILNALGFTDTARTAKNHLAGGDQTDRFSRTDVSLQSLLGLSTAQTAGIGDIVINDGTDHATTVAIDLGADTLATLQTKLAAAGAAVSVTTETEDGQTYYRLLVAGSNNTYTDKNHILETLGLTKSGVSDVIGVAGDVANTSGGAVITADTKLKDIDGYTGYAAGDVISLTGTDTDGHDTVNATLTLDDNTTVGDLLQQIEASFGEVTASLTGEGKLKIVDNTAGASPLAVTIGVKNAGGLVDDKTLQFDLDGALAASVRKRQLVAGADASLTLDGVTATRASNTIDDMIGGVTLNLLKANTDTTVTLKIGRDVDSVLSKVNAFVTGYNTVASYISAQSSYDATAKKTGGVLFGDGTLFSVKSDLTSLLLNSVWGAAEGFSTLGLVGVNVDDAGKLSIDSDTLRGYLNSNFSDVRKLFANSGTTSTGTVDYVSHEALTQPGEYAVDITAAATKSTSAPSTRTSLSGDEVLTIASGSDAATIQLTGTMTMDQIVNTINSGLGTAGMAISASTDSGGRLILTHDYYGSDYSFTIKQQNGLLWDGGDQTVNNGQDVAGTINGEAATGTGQILKGNDGDANVAGLSIKYTGTATGTGVGTVKLTVGVAELFDRALFNITDPVEGYVGFKQQSLQNNIDGYTTQVEEMEAQLAQKKETMTNRFVQMELALQKLQSQSSWLTGQTAAASKGWASI